MLPSVAGQPLNMRPDPPDLRDRLYNPILRPLEKTLNAQPWEKEDWKVPVKNQERTSACTGFALAAMIEALLSERVEISPFMLYYMARRYDEIPGEEDAGSTARAAMKAWFKHGACQFRFWPGIEIEPCCDDPKKSADPDWKKDGFERPLGAYYRVDQTSIADLHAAINETRVVYATALIHSGWENPEDGIIEYDNVRRPIGGHAFLLVGYDREGFWIQNSWGEEWGKHGFARLSYADWNANTMDAWIGQLGVQVSSKIQDLEQGLNPDRIPQDVRDPNVRGRAMLSSNEAVSAQQINPYVVNLENNGRLSDRGQFHTRAVDLRALVTRFLPEFVRQWNIRDDQLIHVALYAHGGLTDEAAAANTARRWISSLYAQQIFPVFFMWETGVLDTLEDIAADVLHRPEAAGAPFWSRALDWLNNQWNDRIETLVSWPGTQAWDEMKENARLASTTPVGGLQQLYAELMRPELDALRPRLRLHLIGHSAGAIFHAHLLDQLMSADPAHRVKVDGIYFMAPAIRTDWFKKLILPHYRNGEVAAYTQFHLADAVELQDDCLPLPYRRSLLYLVSNAFERGHHVPILGMEKFFIHDADLTTKPGPSQVWQWITAPTPLTGPGALDAAHRSQTTKHGGYAADDATRTAVLTQIDQRRRNGAATPR